MVERNATDAGATRFHHHHQVVEAGIHRPHAVVMRLHFRHADAEPTYSPDDGRHGMAAAPAGPTMNPTI